MKLVEDVLSSYVLGRVVTLSSIESTEDLLEKHGDIYSDRLAIVGDETLLLWHQSGWVAVAFALAMGRQILDRGLRPGVAASYRPMQQTQAPAFLSQLLAHLQVVSRLKYIPKLFCSFKPPERVSSRYDIWRQDP